MQGLDSPSLEKFAVFDHILKQGRNSHPLLALSNFLPKQVPCVWRELSPLNLLLPQSCPEIREGALGEAAPGCVESCEDTGTLAVLPRRQQCPAGHSGLGWWNWGAGLVELGCRSGVWVEAGRAWGATARSGHFSWKLQTQIWWLNALRAHKKPSLPSAPEQAELSVHHSRLTRRIYGFNQTCGVSTG